MGKANEAGKSSTNGGFNGKNLGKHWMWENPLRIGGFWLEKSMMDSHGFPIVKFAYRRVRHVVVSKMNHDSYFYFW